MLKIFIKCLLLFQIIFLQCLVQANECKDSFEKENINKPLPNPGRIQTEIAKTIPEGIVNTRVATEHTIEKLTRQLKNILYPKGVNLLEDQKIMSLWNQISDKPRPFLTRFFPDSLRLINFVLPFSNARHAVKTAYSKYGLFARVSWMFNGRESSTNVLFSANAALQNFINQVKGVHNEKYLASTKARAVVIFLHGGGTASTGAHAAMSYIDVLSPYNIDVIGIDLPFHAGGDRKLLIDVNETVRYILSFVKEFVPPKRDVYIMGHSLGGTIALQSMFMSKDEKFPNDIKGIISLSPAVYDGSLEDLLERFDKGKKRQFKDAPDSEKHIFEDLIKKGKANPLGEIYTVLQIITSFNVSKLGENIKQMLPTMLMVGKFDSLVYFGFEDLFKTLKEKMEKNVDSEFTLMEEGINLKNEQEKIGHLIFDYKDENSSFIVVSNILKFIEKISNSGKPFNKVYPPVIDSSKEGESNPINKQMLSDIKNFLIPYVNDLSFRDFSNHYSHFIPETTGEYPKFKLKIMNKIENLKEAMNNEHPSTWIPNELISILTIENQEALRETLNKVTDYFKKYQEDVGNGLTIVNQKIDKLYLNYLSSLVSKFQDVTEGSLPDVNKFHLLALEGLDIVFNTLEKNTMKSIVQRFVKRLSKKDFIIPDETEKETDELKNLRAMKTDLKVIEEKISSTIKQMESIEEKLENIEKQMENNKKTINHNDNKRLSEIKKNLNQDKKSLSEERRSLGDKEQELINKLTPLFSPYYTGRLKFDLMRDVLSLIGENKEVEIESSIKLRFKHIVEGLKNTTNGTEEHNPFYKVVEEMSQSTLDNNKIKKYSQQTVSILFKELIDINQKQDKAPIINSLNKMFRADETKILTVLEKSKVFNTDNTREYAQSIIEDSQILSMEFILEDSDKKSIIEELVNKIKEEKKSLKGIENEMKKLKLEISSKNNQKGLRSDIEKSIKKIKLFIEDVLLNDEYYPMDKKMRKDFINLKKGRENMIQALNGITDRIIPELVKKLKTDTDEENINYSSWLLKTANQNHIKDETESAMLAYIRWKKDERLYIENMIFHIMKTNGMQFMVNNIPQEELFMGNEKINLQEIRETLFTLYNPKPSNSPLEQGPSHNLYHQLYEKINALASLKSRHTNITSVITRLKAEYYRLLNRPDTEDSKQLTTEFVINLKLFNETPSPSRLSKTMNSIYVNYKESPEKILPLPHEDL